MCLADGGCLMRNPWALVSPRRNESGSPATEWEDAAHCPGDDGMVLAA
jgi:hypothetical protein